MFLHCTFKCRLTVQSSVLQNKETITHPQNLTNQIPPSQTLFELYMCVLLLTLLCIPTQQRVRIPFGPFCEGPILLTQSTLCSTSITWLVFNITWRFIMCFSPPEPCTELCVIFRAVFMAEYIAQNTLRGQLERKTEGRGEVTRCPSDPNGPQWL